MGEYDAGNLRIAEFYRAALSSASRDQWRSGRGCRRVKSERTMLEFRHHRCECLFQISPPATRGQDFDPRQKLKNGDRRSMHVVGTLAVEP